MNGPAITPMALLCRDNKIRAIISAETVGELLSLDAASLPRSAAAAGEYRSRSILQ